MQSFFSARFFRNGKGCQYRTTRCFRKDLVFFSTRCFRKDLVFFSTRCFRKDLVVFQRSVFPERRRLPIPNNKVFSERSERFSTLGFSATARVASTEQTVFGNIWSFFSAQFFRNGEGCQYRTARCFRKYVVVYPRSLFPQRQRLPIPNNKAFSERSGRFSTLDFSATAKTASTEQ